MKVTLNGKITALEGQCSLTEILRQAAVPLDQGGVAVAVNDRVVARASWDEIALNEGDRIEVIHAVQGG